jgi:glycosyltransferase involved in cell wall biosynthesis
MRPDRIRAGFVVPRYGGEIVGGAETLARGFAQHLPADRFDVEVLTTCARDHHTWRDELPPGVYHDGSVTVRRFPVSPRDVGRFLAVQQRMSEGFPLMLEEELAWVSGSVNSEALYEYLGEEGGRYHVLFFLPYLFGTTLLGSQVDPARSVLIPCLHDEPFAYLRVVAHLFRSVRAIFFNSAPERSLARRLFGVPRLAPVVGFGFDPIAPVKEGAAAFRAQRGVDGDYLLYFGRKEGGKNLPLLLEHFRGCRDAGRGLSLVVAGDGRIDPADRIEGVVDLPRLEEEEKRAACAGALALCQPSVNESFSIVLMEAWLQETPVLVNARCAVTTHHVALSNGGLYFNDAVEFAREVDYLRRHRGETRELGRQGREYVLENYTWERVLVRFENALRDVLGEG